MLRRRERCHTSRRRTLIGKPRIAAHRLVERCNEVLSPDTREPGEMRLRTEAILREIDASFSVEQLTPELRSARERVVELAGE